MILKIKNNCFWALAAAFLLTLSSCEKDEPLWKLPPPGDEEMIQVAMGETYDNTVFFKFKTQAKFERDVNIFHLAFESSAEGFRVKMNNGKNVQVFNTHSTNFSDAFTASASTAWAYDVSSGNLDSSAVGNWLSNTATRESKNEVFLIDLGTNATPKYKKFQLLAVSDTSYTIKHANLDNSNLQQTTFRKSNIATFTYFDFTTNATVAYEPAPYDYDIVFTKYKNVFLEDGVLMPYSVMGALLNPVNTSAVRVHGVSFDSLTYSMAENLVLSQVEDVIGYDWKYFDLQQTQQYYIDSTNLYVLKDSEGILWKFKFISFVNDMRVKGYPKFIFQRL